MFSLIYLMSGNHGRYHTFTVGEALANGDRLIAVGVTMADAGPYATEYGARAAAKTAMKAGRAPRASRAFRAVARAESLAWKTGDQTIAVNAWTDYLSVHG